MKRKLFFIALSSLSFFTSNAVIAEPWKEAPNFFENVASLDHDNCRYRLAITFSDGTPGSYKYQAKSYLSNYVVDDETFVLLTPNKNGLTTDTHSISFPLAASRIYSLVSNADYFDTASLDEATRSEASTTNAAVSGEISVINKHQRGTNKITSELYLNTWHAKSLNNGSSAASFKLNNEKFTFEQNCKDAVDDSNNTELQTLENRVAVLENDSAKNSDILSSIQNTLSKQDEALKSLNQTIATLRNSLLSTIKKKIKKAMK